MPEEYDEPDRPENLDQPPSFFPYEDDVPIRESGSLGELVEVNVEGVYAAENNGQISRFVVVTDGERKLPILIGAFEAQAIAMEYEGSRPDRPLTHDLIRTIMMRANVVLERVVIDDFWNAVYYAKLNIRVEKEEMEIDARPSDAIALAMRFDSPIFVADGILEAAMEG
ncbi:MAG: bifunctional nuclease family protein [Fimbriimonas sp.]|nr:bifunctional nuclease family protein [Fimbriimonas sp.]